MTMRRRNPWPAFPRILPLGDGAITIEFGDRIDPEIHQRVLACVDALDQAPLPGQLDIVPTYRSLTVYFDPVVADAAVIRTGLLSKAGRPPAALPRSFKTVRLPVLYDPTVAPDLDAVSSEAGLTIPEFISLHTSVTYRVYMLGFMPGFPYLGLVPRRIAVPRLATPRKLIAAGSVGIAGTQTGIYPRESPGGWRIIGRTPVQICDLHGSKPFLLEPGDHVEFLPMTRGEYDECSRMNG
jgi:KipI family sensor histidine kinase inhibitor